MNRRATNLGGAEAGHFPPAQPRPRRPPAAARAPVPRPGAAPPRRPRPRRSGRSLVARDGLQGPTNEVNSMDIILDIVEYEYLI